MGTLESSWICPSCGSTATTRYCANCGEGRIFGSAQIVGHDTATEPRRSFLGRLRATLRTLASPPGQLTVDWIRGKRVRYLAPLSLFLWINVAFRPLTGASHFRLGSNWDRR